MRQPFIACDPGRARAFGPAKQLMDPITAEPVNPFFF